MASEVDLGEEDFQVAPEAGKEVDDQNRAPSLIDQSQHRFETIKGKRVRKSIDCDTPVILDDQQYLSSPGRSSCRDHPETGQSRAHSG